MLPTTALWFEVVGVVRFGPACSDQAQRVEKLLFDKFAKMSRLITLVVYSSSSSSSWASCLSWYSVIKYRTFLSASWNSISSIPSPLYQWRNAFRLYIAPNWVAKRWKIPLRAVVLAMNVALMLLVTGGVSTMELLMLLGIHSTKSSACLFCNLSMFSSTSLVVIPPRKQKEDAKYLPSSGFTLEKKFRAE